MTEPVPTHVEHAFALRTTATYSGGDHVVLDGPLRVGRLVRDIGDALCQPARRFRDLQPTGSAREPDCVRCVRALERLQATGLVSAPTGGVRTRTLPCLGWWPAGNGHDSAADPTCARCEHPITAHVPGARLARWLTVTVTRATHGLSPLTPPAPVRAELRRAAEDPGHPAHTHPRLPGPWPRPRSADAARRRAEAPGRLSSAAPPRCWAMSEPLTDDLRRRTLDAMRTLRRQGHMRPQDVEEMIAAMNHPDASADLVTGILAAASLDDLFRRSDHEASTATAWDQLCAAVADGDHLRTAYCARVVCLPDDNPGPLGSAHPGLVQVMHALAEDISVLWPDDTPVDPEPVDAAVRVAAGPVGVAVLHAAAALAVELFDFGSDAAAMDAWAGEPLAERLSDDAEASELLTALVPDVTASADEAVTAAARVHLTLEQLRPVTP